MTRLILFSGSINNFSFTKNDIFCALDKLSQKNMSCDYCILDFEIKERKQYLADLTLSFLKKLSKLHVDLKYVDVFLEDLYLPLVYYDQYIQRFDFFFKFMKKKKN